MNLSATTMSTFPVGIPRVSGDEPVVKIYDDKGKQYSPRERG